MVATLLDQVLLVYFVRHAQVVLVDVVLRLLGCVTVSKGLMISLLLILSFRVHHLVQTNLLI